MAWLAASWPSSSHALRRCMSHCAIAIVAQGAAYDRVELHRPLAQPDDDFLVALIAHDAELPRHQVELVGLDVGRARAARARASLSGSSVSFSAATIAFEISSCSAKMSLESRS